MKKRFLVLSLILLVLSFDSIGQRDPLLWPFSVTSIWNLPIHHDAEYIDAGIGSPEGAGLLCDEDYLILTPDAEEAPVYLSTAGWTHYADRCSNNGRKLFTVPMPGDFVLNKENWIGETPNAGAAILLKDGTTIIQTQPFARCEAGGPATSWFYWPGISLYGDGIIGAHGGSGMSAIGGTLRLGELVPGGTIRHALKINVYAAKYLYYDEQTEGKRWPAPASDGYADKMYGKMGDPVYECRMGALLALHKELDLNSLEFETGPDGPAMILARALQDYGAYIVDDTYWDVVAFSTEHSPEGRMIDEFEATWGFSFETAKETPWGRDMEKIITRLQVVDNNAPGTIGGGPTHDLLNRRAEPACEFGQSGSGLKCPADDIEAVLPDALIFHHDKITVEKGESKNISYQVAPVRSASVTVLWKSSAEKVAVVDDQGKVTALREGSAMITATAGDGLSDTCIVRVEKRVKDGRKKKGKSAFRLQSGDFYQGGIIVDVYLGDDKEEHGLIVALHDQSEMPVPWGSKEFMGAVSLEDGMENTLTIIDKAAGDDTNPAILCAGYSHNGVDDWYLPAIRELNLVWEQLELINGILESDNDPGTSAMSGTCYWSSSEADSKNAWMEFLPNSFFGYYPKSIRYNVRAVRRF